VRRHCGGWAHFGPTRRFWILACLAAGILTIASGTAPEAKANVALACGDTVTTDVTLTTDLNCPEGVGLYALGPVTIDFAGHSLDGSGTGVAGIWGGATLLNGKIQGFDSGVNGPATVENMTLTRNAYGILGASMTVRVSGSSIVANSRGGIVSAGFALIRDSHILRNGGYGIYTINGVIMAHSTVADNGGHGISVQPFPLSVNDSLVTLTDNVLRNNDMQFFTPYGDPITITSDDFLNSALDITTGYPGGEGSIYVTNSRFINSPLTVRAGVVVDQGGNRGNSCAPEISCAP
jgi:Right handed beta helix region